MESADANRVGRFEFLISAQASTIIQFPLVAAGVISAPPREPSVLPWQNRHIYDVKQQGFPLAHNTVLQQAYSPVKDFYPLIRTVTWPTARPR